MKSEKLFWIAIFSLITCAGLWLLFFHNYPISSKTDDWSNFGSYLGGVTGPLLSFISVILVLRTISLTQKNHEEQIKLIIQDQTYAKFNDLCEYLESAINRSWLNEDNQDFRHIIDIIKTRVIFDNRFREGDSVHNYAITFDAAIDILAQEHKSIDEIALVLESILKYILSYNTADSALMKKMLELRLTKKQRFVIFIKLRSDHPQISNLVTEHWPSFAVPIF